MSFQNIGAIRYFQFDNFENNVRHAIFTRQGGVSPEPWATLNMGGTVGDDPGRVRENRHCALSAIGWHPDNVFDVWQVHGVNVAITNSPRRAESPHIRADAILTSTPNITLMMRFADCVPVFIHDPVRRVVGIIHAGWLGTVSGVIPATIEAMKNHFKTNPKDMIAGIGPSIGPDHYEVGEEVVKQVVSSFGADSSGLLDQRHGRVAFDLWSATRLQLQHLGVEKIQTAGLCTACHLDDWYSHRAEHGHTGRFGAMISLQE